MAQRCASINLSHRNSSYNWRHKWHILFSSENTEMWYECVCVCPELGVACEWEWEDREKYTHTHTTNEP